MWIFQYLFHHCTFQSWGLIQYTLTDTAYCTGHQNQNGPKWLAAMKVDKQIPSQFRVLRRKHIQCLSPTSPLFCTKVTFGWWTSGKISADTVLVPSLLIGIIWEPIHLTYICIVSPVISINTLWNLIFLLYLWRQSVIIGFRPNYNNLRFTAPKLAPTVNYVPNSSMLVFGLNQSKPS